MINFDIITIFPNIFDSYLEESLIKKSQKKSLLNISVHDLRKWSEDKRKIVDDRPFGGGLGMVMKIEPLMKAISDLKKNRNSEVIIFSPRGKKFNQNMAYELSNLDQIIILAGRYEGIDERISKYVADREISIGDYVLMGGEIPAMVILESVSRLIPSVVGKESFLKERIKNKNKKKGFLEYPNYTRPPIFEPGKFLQEIKKEELVLKGKKIKKTSKIKWTVPDILISGNHKKIEEWRKENGKII